MRPARDLIAALVLASTGAACNLVSGVEAFDFDADPGSAGGAAGSGGAAGAGGAGGGGGAATPFCDPGDPNLVACYRFELSASDESANGNDATVLLNVTYAPGKDGAALEHGATTFVHVAANLSWALNIGTIEMWIRPSSIPTGAASSLRAGLLDNDGHYGVFLHPDGQIRCTGAAPLFGGGLVAGEWAHVACVYDGTNVKLYIDGVLTGEAAAALAMPGASEIAIGSNSPSGDPFDGLIDSLRVFNAARTAAEICEAAGGSGC